MKTTRIIFTGGFLGAGKTTLLWEAAGRLTKKGLRVGLITNDQAPELVDTALLSRQGLAVAEVSGSCFCCNFNGLTEAMERVNAGTEADVIMAEPVGSCTDLSATIMQPLKQDWHHRFSVAPLSVLADPARLLPILDGETAGLHGDAAYIFRKQLEESDIILVTKTDTLEAHALASLLGRVREAFPSATALPVSALSGEGMDEWLANVLERTDAGRRIAVVDYDVYARGEAVLGWLNGTVRLTAFVGTGDLDAFMNAFLTRLAERLDGRGYGVGHVKAILENGSRYVAGNLTGNVRTLSLRGSVGMGHTAKLTVNARVETSPEKLDALVREVLDETTHGCYEMTVLAWRCLQPGRPNPTYRYAQVVAL
ncbi:MAG: cobalamin synthesis protein P47K [Tannerella sp.]|jgi:Ni2+-binding GTPase involved in maturation of urease and hydrogenase|nr:cobalamin synthesis protein P47K [Tannerella sp.]